MNIKANGSHQGLTWTKPITMGIIVVMAATLALVGLAACGGATQGDAQEGAAESSESSSSGSRVDKAELGELIDEAKALVKDAGADDAAAKSLSEVIETAEKAYADGKATKVTVNRSVTALRAAIDAYKKGGDPEKAAEEPAEAEKPSDDGAAEQPSGQGAGGQAASNNGGSDSGSGSNGGGGGSAPAASQPAQSSGGGSGSNAGNSSAPAKSEPQRRWVEEQGHYETVVVQEAWDEPIYEVHPFCTACGEDLAYVNATYHILWDAGSICAHEVQVGSTHHDAVTEQRWVVDVPGHWE